MIARSWTRRVTLCTNDADVFHAIRYLECDPEIVGALADDLTISVEPYRSYYRIMRDGEILTEQMVTRGITDSLHALLAHFSYADFQTAPFIHAACLRYEGRRVLFVGSKGAGKTVLTLRLIHAGFEVEGDENVFVTSEGVIARPRGLRIKESAVQLLPHLNAVLRYAPYYRTLQGWRIYSVDPRRAGAAFWRIRPGPVDAVIVLRQNHGGLSSLRRLSPLDLLREVLEECRIPETGRAAAVAAIVRVISPAKGFDLSVGELDGALACIDSALKDLP